MAWSSVQKAGHALGCTCTTLLLSQCKMSLTEGTSYSPASCMHACHLLHACQLRSH